MSDCPYIKIHGDKVLGILKMYSRMGAYPLDSTSVFDTYEKMIEYINEPGSYAYPGQIIAVANGTIDATNGDKDYTIYVIKSDRSVQVVNADGTGTVDIPTATKDKLGMVKLSDKSTVNGVSVNESGQLVINSVSINNIIQESGDELILQCGDGSL